MLQQAVFRVAFMTLIGVQAHALTCDQVHRETQARANYQAPSLDAVLANVNAQAQKYGREDVRTLALRLKTTYEQSTDLAVRKHVNDAMDALKDFHEPFQQDYISAVWKKLPESPTYENLRQALMDQIPQIYTRAEAAQKVDRYLSGKLTLNGMLKKLTHEQVLQRVMGKSTAESIDPQSMLGRFLTEAAAIKGGPITMKRMSFPAPPGQRSAGNQKWFIHLDESIFPLYKKYFTGPNFLTHLHDHGQGTLFLSYEGMAGSYARFNREVRMQGAESLWPSVILSDVEANRMKLFVHLGNRSNELAQYPWNLARYNNKTGEVQSYVEKGYFECCTHWFGNIPLGEQKTTRYILPGNDPANVREAQPITTKLAPYTRTIEFDYKDNVENRQDFLDSSMDAPAYAKLVWKAPGHQQLWEVLGLKNSQVTGELANPGYVVYSLAGKTKEDRVPFVFVTGADARDPLPAPASMKDWIYTE